MDGSLIHIVAPVPFAEETRLHKSKGMFLYRTVDSPLDRSKRFTLLALPGRPVHFDTHSGSPGISLVMQQLRATTK